MLDTSVVVVGAGNGAVCLWTTVVDVVCTVEVTAVWCVCRLSSMIECCKLARQLTTAAFLDTAIVVPLFVGTSVSVGGEGGSVPRVTCLSRAVESAAAFASAHS